MASRLIRDSLLDSDKYWAVSIEAQRLFVHLMLLADDLGLVSLAPAFVRRRAFNDNPPSEKVDRLLADLADFDLIRMYDANGARYGFIPRFGQRLRIKRVRHPLPPEQLVRDDDDALNKIKELVEKLSARCRTVRPEPEPEPEPEPKNKETIPGGMVPGTHDDLAIGDGLTEKRRVVPAKRILTAYAGALPDHPQWQVVTEQRKALLRARWSEVRRMVQTDDDGVAWFEAFFRRVASSPFLTGRSHGKDRTPFMPGLDWLLKAQRFAQVTEGFFDDRAGQTGSYQPGIDEFLRRAADDGRTVDMEG